MALSLLGTIALHGCADSQLLDIGSRVTVDADPDAFEQNSQPDFAAPTQGFHQRELGADDDFQFTALDSSLLTVTRVDPAAGPVGGGNVARVIGSGFTDEALVFVDGRMVQPADTRLIDANALSVVMPAGEIGSADVRVHVGDLQAVAEGAYSYYGLLLAPVEGSVAGNTLVTITVADRELEDGMEVRFGEGLCTDIRIVTPTRLTCRTPTAAVGVVDVELRYPDGKDTILASDAFRFVDLATSVNGGLAGEPIDGVVNVSVFERMTNAPLPGAFVMIGNDPNTALKGYTNERGQLTLSAELLKGPVTVHISLDCFVSTTFVAMDASFVTALLNFTGELRCLDDGDPPSGGSRRTAGALISGELRFPGSNEFAVNPWDVVPEPREDEIRVAYVYTTRPDIFLPDVSPARVGTYPRVVEGVSPVGETGYPYKIFARPAGLAVYALSGLERTSTGEFTPYVMGVARNVVTSPGEETTGVNIDMNIPLDRRFQVAMDEIPAGTETGPLQYRAQLHLDLGGEGVISRRVNGNLIDVQSSFTGGSLFDFFAQPAFIGSLTDARYVVVAGWYTGGYDTYPYTEVIDIGVKQTDEPVTVKGFLGIPNATEPADGAYLSDDRVLRWEADGAQPDLHIVTFEDLSGGPVWRFIVPGDIREITLPDLSAVEGAAKLPAGVLSWTIRAVRIDGFSFNRFDYADVRVSSFTHDAINAFIVQNDAPPPPITPPLGADLGVEP